ncbi:hypothetical protein [Butyrivibrio sp. VCD2006]|uniref:hypothetical protein n=1 Tax=Butyrivibrio sp. VCD2006 TaxID=1280664 RepID=UPI0004098B65|nr:hypothetical protein [Butyrivibrio sp. VCD2006]
MGILDFLYKKVEPVRPSVPQPSPAGKQERQPTKQNGPRMIKPNREWLKVTDTKKIEKNIKVEAHSQEFEMKFYCPIRNAKVYCHSVIIDKLGDLTKFIILSLYEGHTVEEINMLTQMGNTTIKEEIDYLIHGGLINDDRQTLTELGEQYGMLLEKFSELSEGINIAFNVFADRFEPIEDDLYVRNPDNHYILRGNYIPALTRNDNYANSLEIAKNCIEAETPFCSEIKNSLYATVKIDREETKYKPVYIKDFKGGYSSENDSCVKIAISCDKVTYKPQYSWIDPYREIITKISCIGDKYEDLLSDKGKLLIKTVNEEDEADKITTIVNNITGQIIRTKDDLVPQPNDQSIYVLETRPVKVGVDETECKGIYLKEISRENLFQIRYFPYNRMEVCGDEARGGF